MLRILGVEQTQAIQYFGSTFPVCVGGQPCADNTIPLVAGKPTVVRVYFEGAAQDVVVTGFGVRLNPDGSPSSTTFPGKADLVNVPSPPSRENELHSLNIEIPPTQSRGQWKLMLSIFEKASAGVAQVASRQVDLGFVERALVPIRLVRLRYTRTSPGAPMIDIPAPTVADFWSMAEGFVQHIWPSPLPVFCIVRDSVEAFDGDYGGQNPNTDTPVSRGSTGSISQIIANLRVAEGLSADVVYCGFYPAGPGINEPGLPSGGFGGGGTFVAPSVIPGLMAHELGHALGSMHTFDDPNYPHYGSLPAGTIGEVGFDALQPPAVEPGNIPPGTVPQRTHLDIMNYGAPRWISPYTYSNLFQAVGAPKTNDPCRPIPRLEVMFFPDIHKQFICDYVVGLPDDDFLAKICGPRLKVGFPPFPRREGRPKPVRLTVLDGRGDMLFTDTFEATPLFEDVADLASLSGSDAGPRRYQFAISVPDLDGATRLIVEYEGKLIEDVALSAEPVALTAEVHVLDGSVPMVRVEWSLPTETAYTPVFVRASSDDGLSWTAFNVPSGATQLDFDPASLPPGDGCLVEVLAGAQLQTTSWRSERLPVSTGRDELLVLQPRDAISMAHGEEIALSAVSTYGSGYRECIWSSDRDGDLGTGGYQVVRLSPGRHRLTVRRGPCGERVPGGVVEVIER
jgi:hypothetical protein